MIAAEVREEVLVDLVKRLAVEAEDQRRRAARAPGPVDGTTEDEVLEMLDAAIGKVLEDWSPTGREARVAKRIHTELRLEIRRHFAE